MVLHEKRIGFEIHEVDLSNKSEEFLSVSPYGKVLVLRVNGTSLYQSNVVRTICFRRNPFSQARQ
jgi:glutathione S-transferase